MNIHEKMIGPRLKERRELQLRTVGVRSKQWYGRVTHFELHPTKGWRKMKSSGWRFLRAA